MQHHRLPVQPGQPADSRAAQKADGADIASFVYTLNAAGQRTQVAERMVGVGSPQRRWSAPCATSTTPPASCCKSA
ncbi:hypothetical protein [Comamonas sp. JC664]|uniref:hypothetical protein n=1 Tax=Comamonas sp. JC664 TaxID=2801917 RepID=UPI003671FF2C